MKTFWQHRNGKLFALQRDTFGHIVAAAGPFDWEDLRDPEQYEYDRGMAEWATNEIKRHALHRLHPASVR